MLIEDGYTVHGIDADTYNPIDLNDLNKYPHIIVYSPATAIPAKVLEILCKKSIVFCGNVDEETRLLMCEREIEYHNLLKDEEYVLKNAIPTAEGALQMALSNTVTTIKNSIVSVLGFGRVGKYVTKLFKDVGAAVTVFTGDQTEYAAAYIYADKVYDLRELNEKALSSNIIINTIPASYLDNYALLRKDVFILELASKPFGIDLEKCKKFCLNAADAPSLPAKTAPKSAALYLKESILKNTQKN